jgi:hypothetical protein
LCIVAVITVAGTARLNAAVSLEEKNPSTRNQFRFDFSLMVTSIGIFERKFRGQFCAYRRKRYEVGLKAAC